MKGLDTEVIQSDEFCAVFPENHDLAAKSFVTLEDLIDEPYLLLEEGAYSEPLEAFHKADIQPNIRLAVHDDYSIISMVEQGLGYSIMANLVLKKADYRVVSRPIMPPIVRTLAIVMKDKRSLPLAAKTFLKCFWNNIN